LVQLLTHLRFETGFRAEDMESGKYEIARAGLEHDIRREDSPYIVKSPGFCDYVEEVISRDDIAIEHVFVPIRDLYAAAESRRRVMERAVSQWRLFRRLRHKIRAIEVAGGLWHTSSRTPGKQEEILLKQIYKLVLALSDTTIPVTFMRYPRIVKDGPYLFEKMKPILVGISYDEFHAVFKKTVRPDLVDSFSQKDF